MSSRAVSVVVAFLTLGGLWACWSDLSMIWDGAYQFCYTLIEQRAYFHETRFHSWVVWQPVLWLSTMIRDLGWLRFVYGLPFCMAPLVGFAVSWWVTRRHAQHLLLWATFGTAAAMLPGQVFIINDSIFQMHLFWPVFLGLMVPLSMAQRIVLGLLAVFQLSHPIGMVLFGGSALVLALLAYETEAEQRRTFIVRGAVMMILAIVAFLKVVLFPDPYAASEFTFWAAWTCWKQGVAGLPLAGWICMAAAGVLLHLAGRMEPPRRDRYGRIALAGVCVAAFVWIFWAASPERWAKALDYRRFVVPLSAPFFVLAWLEMRKSCGIPGPVVLRLRSTSACLIATLFLCVMGMQSTQWQTMQGRLFRELAQRPETVVPPRSFSWMQATALNHWGVTALPIAYGKTDKFLLETEQADLLRANPPLVPLSFFRFYPPEPGSGGWFDFRATVAKLENEEPAGAEVQARPAVLKAGASQSATP